MSHGSKVTFVGVPDPLLHSSDLVQPFTEALTAKENIWRIGKEHLAMSFKSIMLSSAGWALHCSSGSFRVKGTYSFTLLEKSLWKFFFPSREMAGSTAKVNPAAGQSQATRSKVRLVKRSDGTKKKESEQPVLLRATDFNAVLLFFFE